MLRFQCVENYCVSSCHFFNNNGDNINVFRFAKLIRIRIIMINPSSPSPSPSDSRSCACAFAPNLPQRIIMPQRHELGTNTISAQSPSYSPSFYYTHRQWSNLLHQLTPRANTTLENMYLQFRPSPYHHCDNASRVTIVKADLPRTDESWP